MSRLGAALQAARDTKRLEIGRGILPRAAEIFGEVFGDAPAVLLVADPNTWRAAGRAVADAFAAAGQANLEVLELSDPALYAEHRFVEQVQSALAKRGDAVPVAVGSGTINDLVKLASHRAGRQYLCVATAASMDGYTAYGASITDRGSKQTFDCPAPRAVIADLDVISAAPSHLNAAGYADLLAKLTAGADWIIADALGVEPIDPPVWETVQQGLREAIADPAGVRAGASAAIAKLIEGLMMGGFAMQAHLTSRPASGAEHQFSHLWDMEHHVDPRTGVAPSHGFKVGVATVAVARLYEALLTMPLESLDIAAACAAWPAKEQIERAIERMFRDPSVRAVARRESLAKYIPAEALRGQLERLREVWPELSARLRAQLPPATELARMLDQAGAPSESEQIGLSRQELRMSAGKAFHIRRRFTVLDLAGRANVLDACLNAALPG